MNGKIKKWNDEKGFGFITLESSSEDIFFHINAFRGNGQRPSIGMAVSFDIGADNQGRKQARNVRVAGSEKLHPAVTAISISGTFLGAVAILAYLGYVPKLILWLYIAASIFSFLIYAWDKKSAENGDRRTPEATLHNFSLIGGWPGALFAQQLLRHKSKKESFRRMFWVTVFLNISALIYLISPYGNWLSHILHKISP